VNELLRVIIESGISSERFGIYKSDETPLIRADSSPDILEVEFPVRITLRATGFYFLIEYRSQWWAESKFRATYFPDIGVGQTSGSALLREWADVLECLTRWVLRVRKEVLQPDPWSVYTQGKALGVDLPSGNIGTEKISAEEMRPVRNQTRLIREYVVREANPTKQQLDEINEKLDYMEESAQRLNKRDWTNIAISTIVNIVTTLAMDRLQAQGLFALVAETVRFISVPLLR
jgi:hypothetical protein